MMMYSDIVLAKEEYRIRNEKLVRQMQDGHADTKFIGGLISKAVAAVRNVIRTSDSQDQQRPIGDVQANLG